MLRRIKAHQKRRCPHCQSGKWEWLGAIPITPEELEHHLLVKYRCLKCGNEFEVEEAKGNKRVKSADQCIFCASRRLEKTSMAGADVEIWRCLQCNGYMVIDNRSESGKL